EWPLSRGGAAHLRRPSARPRARRLESTGTAAEHARDFRLRTAHRFDAARAPPALRAPRPSNRASRRFSRRQQRILRANEADAGDVRSVDRRARERPEWRVARDHAKRDFESPWRTGAASRDLRAAPGDEK